VRALLAAVVVVALACGLLFGSTPLSLSKALTDADSVDRALFLSLRLPRVLLGFVTGSGLALVGGVLQTTLRNPLADPFVLGVSGGAALFASIAMLLGLGASTSLVLPLCALVGGMLASVLVLALVRDRSRSGDLILAGIVVNSIAAGVITLLKTLAPAQKAQMLLFWLTGFLDVPDFSRLAVVVVYVAVGAAACLVLAPKLNLLSLGDASARSLGVNPERLFALALLACSLITGAVVSVTGLIGFVGLIVPHVVRAVLGADLRKNLVPTAMLGGATLVLCDALCRVLFRTLGTEPPVGVVTALLGGPGFLYILGRARKVA
jgi:iron complex transport system permease protein